MDDRDELFRNWSAWVTSNLGRDPHLVGAAATAATEAAQSGQGFNLAAAAARAAWSQAVAPVSLIDPRSAALILARVKRSTFLAWIALAAAWAWPIAVVVVSRTVDARTLAIAGFELDLSLLDVFVIPAGSILAVSLAHAARADIKQIRARAGSVARIPLVLGYITLIGSPVSVIAFFIAAVGVPPIGVFI